MATIRISPDVLAHILDLPEGSELGAITRIPVPGSDYQHIYQMEVIGEGWPDGLVDLTYSSDAYGRVALSGFTPVPE